MKRVFRIPTIGFLDYYTPGKWKVSYLAFRLVFSVVCQSRLLLISSYLFLNFVFFLGVSYVVTMMVRIKHYPDNTIASPKRIILYSRFTDILFIL